MEMFHIFIGVLIKYICCWSVTKLCPDFVNPWTKRARLPCPSLSPRVCSNSCPLSWLCYLTISFSSTSFSFCFLFFFILIFFNFNFNFFKFYFMFKLYIIVLVLPNIKMNPPQVYMCSPSWTLHPPPSLYHPSGSYLFKHQLLNLQNGNIDNII